MLDRTFRLLWRLRWTLRSQPTMAHHVPHLAGWLRMWRASEAAWSDRPPAPRS